MIAAPAAHIKWDLDALEQELPRHVLTGSMRYTKFEPLGHGGKAEVLRCYDVNLQRPVAFKVLHKQLADRAMEQQMLVREARLLASLNHPAIPTVHDLGRDRNGRPYFTMTLVEGTTLFDIEQQLRDDDPATTALFSIEHLLGLLIDVAKTLEHAHTAGVVHGDVKPENIIIDGQRDVHLLDWGIATLLSAAGADNPLEARWGRQGSALYMSPEQAQRARTLGPASDIYSLGVVLYECLTLRCPLHGETSAETLDMVVEVEPPAPSEVAGATPVTQQLDEVCLRALAKAPEDRFGSMAEFRQALYDCQLDLFVQYDRRRQDR